MKTIEEINQRVNEMRKISEQKRDTYSMLNGALFVYTTALREFHCGVVNHKTEHGNNFTFTSDTEKGREEYANARDDLLNLIKSYDEIMSVEKDGISQWGDG